MFTGNLEFFDRAVEAMAAFIVPRPVERGVTPREEVLRINKMRLLHYASSSEPARGPPVLLVYALVNRYYILDLDEGRSVVRTLLDSGLDVYIIDWGEPTVLDAQLSLHDYVNHYLDACVDMVRERAGVDNVSLLGYCQGGTMAAMHAAIHPEKVKSLVLMAAPLDYSRDRGLLSFWTHKSLFDPERLAGAFGSVPQEILDVAFVLLKPVENTAGKFRLLQRKVRDPEFVDLFFKMEAWIRGGVPQAGAAYTQFVRDIYLENKLVGEGVRLGGRVARLSDVRAPTLLLVAKYDHIVPPGETLSAVPAFKRAHADHLIYPAGHVGLSVNPDAHKVVWPVVARWILEHARPDLERPRPVREMARMVFQGEEREVAEREILTVDDIAGERPDHLSRKMNIPLERARLWIEEWRTLAASISHPETPSLEKASSRPP